MGKNNQLLSNLRYDFPSSIVVFLVALPLCLGIALASGAPTLFAGIISGIVGGLVIGTISKSSVSVSGPAAGLTVIVLNGIQTLNSFEIFLTAIIIAGALQIVFGVIRAGLLGNFFPVAVIKGMLAAIGLILILKQIPHFLGYDADFEGDQSFVHMSSYEIFSNISKAGEQNTFTDIIHAVLNPNIGAIIVGVIALLILIGWSIKAVKNNRILSLIPAPLLAVVAAIVTNLIFVSSFPELALSGNHLVEVPMPKSFDEFKGQFTFPDFSAILNKDLWIVAVTIAIIASLESLLSIDAADKLNPGPRVTPPNRELIAQGVGNMTAGLIGGLPVTAVIVRSSANIAAGARSKMSAILHGVWLLLAVIFIPRLLNMIPLAALAAILFQVGFKLVTPKIFAETYRKGWSQFLPFVITVIAILFSDLLIGIMIGMAAGIFFVMRSNFSSAISVTKDKGNYLIRFKKDVSFLNKFSLRKAFDRIPDSSYVIIDINKSALDHDIRETIEDFRGSAEHRDITIEIKQS